MTTQPVGRDEALVAEVANKRPIAGVRPHVGLQLVCRYEPAVTQLANVRPFSRVNSTVHLQLVVRDEAFVAYWTHKRSTVQRENITQPT